MLIQDVDAMKSSAALSMGVGSLRDPPTAQGLAHYLEHMLFMGTAKYPDENDYSNVRIIRCSLSQKMEEVIMLILLNRKLIICCKYQVQHSNLL
ncbi:MAG: hypothetical protein E6Q89_01510 [Bacteroidia bacterium]|nr:MAG: hypothetical protein E6Q89_01510 [Bacteroidia bacterium]